MRHECLRRSSAWSWCHWPGWDSPALLCRNWQRCRRYRSRVGSGPLSQRAAPRRRRQPRPWRRYQRRSTKAGSKSSTSRTGARSVVHRSTTRFEAPNWSRDGSHLLINQQGSLYRIPVAGGAPVKLDIGSVEGCNNDHGYSPDGTLLAISCRPSSSVYVVAAGGGTPRLLTPLTPSYWHGWSPDGRTLAYVGSSDGEFDIYTMPVDGGPETRLTTAKGLDDGPGLHAGRAVDLLQLGAHRDDADLADATRRQRPAAGDLRRAVCRLVPASLARRQVAGLRVLRRDGRGAPAVQGRGIAADGAGPPQGQPRGCWLELFGGQGTINVPSWSPDSRRFAFVSWGKAP